jgi:hypothetical protein
MINSKHFSNLLAVIILAFILSACGNRFLNTKPEDKISLKNFYSTDKEVKASTNILYGAPWFKFNMKFMWAVGDITSGNERTYSADVKAFGDFSFVKRGTGGSTSTVLNDGWGSLWTIVAQANSLINNLKKRVSPDVNEEYVKYALGEAHVMRAVAYFYLVRLWGPIPIIKNNSKHSSDPNVPRYKVEDVYQFIINDLKYGINHCKQEDSGLYNGGHVTAGSAKALLAKVYLTIHKYGKAHEKAHEVIMSHEFQLLDNFADLFKTKYNNNPETIIALQWSDKGYGLGNGIQSSYAYSNTITGVAVGYGVVGPTIDLQRAYEKGDLRLKPTIMMPGYHYPEITKDQGGYTVPKDVNAQGTDAAIKKYVIGTPADNGGVGTSQARTNQTYLLRYAGVLLTNAESILAPDGDFNKSTSNQEALDSFNKVRERAGLPAKSSITEKDILHAWRVEFALGGHHWYTLLRLKNRDKVADIMHDQIRGRFAHVPRRDPPKVYRVAQVDKSKIQWLLPYPEVDFAKNKYLNEPPQSYDFDNNNK